MRRAHLVVTGVVVLGVLLASRAGATPLGVDDFEDGTTQGWFASLGFGPPHPAPPINVSDGGPLGLGDNFLLLTAIGASGPGSRLTAMNASQWTGNFLTGALIDIVMDAKNFGPADLYLRLAFEDPMGGPPSNVAFSADPVVLPAGGGWTPIAFPIMPSSLTAGIGSVADALANTTLLRIYHSPASNFPNPVFPIDTVNARLRLDNIGIVIGSCARARGHAAVPDRRGRCPLPTPVAS